MKDLPPATPAWFDADDCDLSVFATLCAQTLDPGTVPHAADVIRNVAVYDGPALRPMLDDDAQRRNLMAEWARTLLSGGGVFVIRNAWTDTAPIDAATAIYTDIISHEREVLTAADHFATGGVNDRVWNALQKLCLADPAVFAAYFGNPLIDAACEAWLGPAYQMTAQVNLVRPGGKAQAPHRDYHLGFQTAEDSARYPAHVHDLSPTLTLQGGIAHCDMDLDAGPTKLLPFSQAYRPGYAAYRLAAFRDHFEAHHVQVPLRKGDAIFFNPALFHAGGENRTADVQRFVNLLQVGSAMGRTLEAVDRTAMCLALYPVLRTTSMSPAKVRAAVAACAEGYPFPTHLDTDPPAGGLAPESQAALMRRALDAGMTVDTFARELEAQNARRRG